MEPNERLPNMVQASDFEKFLTVAGEENSIISLKCDLAFAPINSINHKVMWYSNGAFLQSTAPLELYNFTLSSVGSAGSKPTGTLLTCAHHILSSPGQSKDSFFHGNLMKIYQSSNHINLKVKGKFSR